MTRQQFADELLMHRRLMWALPKGERDRRLSQIADDLQFEEDLRVLREQMKEAA